MYAHRLVGISFLENPCNLPEINHMDLNKNNNPVVNLEWCDKSFNQKHLYANNVRNPPSYWIGKSGALHTTSKQMVWMEF